MSADYKYRIITDILFAAVCISALFFGVKYALALFLPFLLGFFIAFLLKPLIRGISSLFHIRRKLSAAIAVVLTYAAVGAILWWAGNLIFWQLFLFFKRLPDIFLNDILPVLNSAAEFILTKIEALSGIPAEKLMDFSPERIIPAITDYSGKLVGAVSRFVSKLPAVIVTAVFTVISSVFISLDYANIVSFMTRQLPPKIRACFFEIKDFLVNCSFKVIKAYVILMALTFSELCAAFLLLGVPMAVPTAFLIAFADFLPLIGTGGILIPWVIFEIIRKNYYFAAALAIVYAIVTVVRNIAEPKIVGSQVGLHPLVTLVCMYTGVKLFGFLGLIILPIIVLIAKQLNDTGKLRIWKS